MTKVSNNTNNISIIIPTYKRNKYLLKIINNLNRQFFFNNLFEIIVIDSFKNNFFRELKLKNTRYFNITENSNALKRNIGIKKAKYKNIIFMDDDCFPSNTFLKDYNSLFKILKNKKIICGSVVYDQKDIIKNDYLTFRLKNHFVIKKNFFPQEITLTPSNIVTMNMGLKLNYFSNFFFRKEFKNYGFEDFEFGFRYIKNGYRIVGSHPLVTHKEDRNYINYLNKFYFLGNKGCKIFSNINFAAYKSTKYYNLENILSIFKKNQLFIWLINALLKLSIFLFNFKLFKNKYLFKFTVILAFASGVLDRFNNENRQLIWY
jgi:glycosyltransferase involved in cell wall biosynthesis